MRVGELRKALEGVADDVPVMVGFADQPAGLDNLSTRGAFTIGDRTDSHVGALLIELSARVPHTIIGADFGKDPGRVVFACTCLTKTGFRGATCKACGGIIRAGGGLD